MLASSFPAARKPETVSAFLFPSFRFVPEIPNTGDAVARFAAGFLRAETLHSAHDGLAEEHRRAITRDAQAQNEFPQARDVEDVMVLICGHGGRDKRCGVLGPLLRDEFEREFERRGIATGAPKTSTSSPSPQNDSATSPPSSYRPTSNLPLTLLSDLLDHPLSAQVGLISHIGGHKFAGNVIVYIPPSLTGHPLKGMGIWYGRVAPQHVEDIVAETVLKGKVVRELWRGAVRQGGELGREWDLHAKRA
jgi:(2Fe-2S) ferredoxin